MDLTSFEKIVFITGAGISAPSGLPTYRDDETSLWNDAEFMRKSHINYAQHNPDELWSYWGPLKADALKSSPNPAHYALSHLETNHTVLIGTQNVDGLHTRAGSSHVVELHGSLSRSRCLDQCGYGAQVWDDGYCGTTAPMCMNCDGPVFPDVVLFGEFLDETNMVTVERAVRECDLFVMVGTSGEVWPVVSYLDVAVQFGKPAILINKQEWDHPHPGFTEKHYGPAEELLPDLFGV